MASKAIELSLALILVTMLCSKAMAQSSCTNVLMGLSPCLNYITGNSSSPSTTCCSSLTNAVQSQPQCLCSVLNSGGNPLGLAINQTLALALPGACNVQTPPVSQCNAAASGPTTAATAPGPTASIAPTGPTTSAISPASSPTDSPKQTPETPLPSAAPSGGGSKTVPSTQGNSSAGSIIKSPLHLVLFFIFFVSCVSTTATRF